MHIFYFSAGFNFYSSLYVWNLNLSLAILEGKSKIMKIHHFNFDRMNFRMILLLFISLICRTQQADIAKYNLAGISTKTILSTGNSTFQPQIKFPSKFIIYIHRYLYNEFLQSLIIAIICTSHSDSSNWNIFLILHYFYQYRLVV